MKEMIKKTFSISILALGLIGCAQTEEQKEAEAVIDEPAITDSPIDFPLSVEERDALTPEDVVAEFKEGNVRFMNADLTTRNIQGRIERTVLDQFPKAMVVSCIDSRVPVEAVFNQGLGDIFVGRIAGNFVDTEMLGSLEYATKVAGSKLIVVMGHEGCGAVKSAIAGVELGNITALLENIEPAIEMTKDFPEEERTIKNKEFVNNVITNNVLFNMQQIRDNSPIIAEMEQNNEIKIIGAYYDITNGEVRFLEGLN